MTKQIDVKALAETLAQALLNTAMPETPKGFIVFKKENHTKQVFFSDHKPVDGVDEFGHSTKKKDRFLEEAYKHDTFEDAANDLIGMIVYDTAQLFNDAVVTLGIYDVENDKVVYTLNINNASRGDDTIDLF